VRRRYPFALFGGFVEKPVLLLVEDDALVALAAEESLQAGGYTVVLAASGTEALGLINAPAANFAGLVADIRLGSGPDGWQVARRARERRSDLPILYVTGDSGGEWPTHGVPNSLLVQKPYAPAQLLAAIGTLITAADTNGTI
jgi:CheY-like chemotaxis protein